MTADAYITIIKDFAPLIVSLFFLGFMVVIALAMRPVVNRVITGLADKAGANSMAFGLALGYGLSASLSAMSEQADKLGWLILAAMAKIINPFIVGVLAFTARSSKDAPAPTAPPPPPPSPPAQP